MALHPFYPEKLIWTKQTFLMQIGNFNIFSPLGYIQNTSHNLLTLSSRYSWTSISWIQLIFRSDLSIPTTYISSILPSISQIIGYFEVFNQSYLFRDNKVWLYFSFVCNAKSPKTIYFGWCIETWIIRRSFQNRKSGLFLF